MLPAHNRLTTSADFTSVMRSGSKAGRSTVVVYVARTGNANSIAGFAVSKAVGGAVVRNRVKRRLRAIIAGEISQLPDAVGIVVRALPASASASFETLRGDVAGALRQAHAKVAA